MKWWQLQSHIAELKNCSFLSFDDQKKLGNSVLDLSNNNICKFWSIISFLENACFFGFGFWF